MKKLIVLASFLMLLGCGQQQSEVKGDAFEYAKKYVWGDKVNGCNYKVIVFDNKNYYQQNSKEIIKKIKTLDGNFEIAEFEQYPIIKVSSNKSGFNLRLANSGAGRSLNSDNNISFSIDGDNIFISELEKNSGAPSRNGAVYPTDYSICAKR